MTILSMTSRLEIVIENRINGVNDVKIRLLSFPIYRSLVVSCCELLLLTTEANSKSLKFDELEIAEEMAVEFFISLS